MVAGHDLKFFTPLLSYLRLQPDLEVRLDQWAALGKHDPAASRELAAWADVVVCEWCGPNAVWYSRHKRRGSRLLVRLHRFELRSPYPGQLKIGAVNQVICVSKHYARLCREHTGWPETKVATVPNALDVAQLDRPKLDGARFHLGLVGMVPSRKRLDLALDVLEELRREDDRYLLFVKSGMPWEHWWVWQNPAEREHYADALRRVQRSPLLRGAVVFDDAGPDVAAWLRRVGFVLSTSDDESFHVAPAEGMASRAVPVLRHWPGAETIYDMRWIHRGPAEMAAAIMALGDERRLARGRRRRARPGGRRVQPGPGVRGLARPAHRGPGPGGARADPRAARLPLTAHVLHARRQRGHAARRAPRWPARPEAPTRGSCRSRPGAGSLACPRRARRRAPLGRPPGPGTAHAAAYARGHRTPAHRTPARSGPRAATVRARTGLARVDPVYLAEVAGAVVVSDRACWAAAVTGRLGDPDPAMAGAFLSLGYPVGDATPFRGVRALGGDRELRVIGGRAGR